MNAAELPFNTLRNFVCRLVIYRLCSRIFFSWTKVRRKIALCSSELSLDMPWNFMRTFKRTFIEKSREQRTKFAHFACITFAQYCMCNGVWDGFQVYACFNTVVSTQMEVDFHTHRKSIWHKRRSIRYKLKPFQTKSELAEIHVSQYNTIQ